MKKLITDSNMWFFASIMFFITWLITETDGALYMIFACASFIFGIDATRWDEYSAKLKKVMGLINAHLMHSVEPVLETIKLTSSMLIANKNFETFRISTKRQYKDFELTSQELNQEIGAHLQPICNKPVKLKGADLNVVIELVNGRAYIGVDRIQGYGGLPVGTGENAIVSYPQGLIHQFHLLK